MIIKRPKSYSDGPSEFPWKPHLFWQQKVLPELFKSGQLLQDERAGSERESKLEREFLDSWSLF